jgi:hypothetical protein
MITIMRSFALLLAPREFVPPNPTSIVLRARDDSITLVIKRAREDLVGMSFQDLQERA